ncbi:MAG: hypothetical protein O2968_23565 [Acidobacteria bacterium]|nr:hypothetical protein [Acidobacteriota bacterium]
MKKRTASILKWVGIVVVVLGFAYGAMDFASRRALKREYDALRAEGRPMELREIVPPAIPNDDNAALVYNAAVQMLQAEPPVKLDGYATPSGRVIGNLFEQLGDVVSTVLGSPTNTVAAEHAARLLDHPRVVEFLATIERGSERAGYRQELDYTQGAGLLLPHLSDNRAVSRTLSALARRQAAAGKTDAAWRTVRTGIRFADSLRDEPILISQLVRVSQLAIAVNALQAVAEVAPPSVDDCAKLEMLLASIESRETLVRTFDAERLLLGEWGFRQPASVLPGLVGDVDGYSKYLLTLRFVLPLLGRRDHAAYLHVIHGYTRNAAESYAPEDVGIGDQMLKEVPRYCILTQMLLPALSASKAKFTSMIAQARVTRAGLAAIRFKHEHGAFPSDLQALKLANADDPFTSKPLIYRTTDRGFTIYSVDVNLVDDGGTKGKDSKSGDEVWRYEERNPAEQTAGGDGKPAPQP